MATEMIMCFRTIERQVCLKLTGSQKNLPLVGCETCWSHFLTMIHTLVHSFDPKYHCALYSARYSEIKSDKISIPVKEIRKKQFILSKNDTLL